MNGLFRKRKIYFAQVSNVALRDEKLTLKAKGLYALIESYIRIEGFTLYQSTLRNDCKEGERAFESAWKELKDNGYLIQYKMKGNKGQFYYEYELLEEPEVKNVGVDTNKDTSISPQPQNVGVGNVEIDNVDGGICRSAKVGGYSNTNNKNTNTKNTNLNNTTTQHNVVSSANVELIQRETHLELSPNMKATVEKWDTNRLAHSLKIFKQENGRYFNFLNKIYMDNGKHFSNNNVLKFCNFEQREYDYTDLENKLLGWDN